MKSYNNLFEKVVSIRNIKDAIWNASIKKRKRKDVVRIISSIDSEAEKIRMMLIEEQYKPGHGKPHQINDNNSLKIRTIVKPHFAYDQIIHHAVIQVLGPIFMKGMYEYVSGSVPKRGAHKAAARIMKWNVTDPKGTRYCLKCDIRHFYRSVDKKILRMKLAERIRDKKLMRLLDAIIDSSEHGLPLGYYTSQWFANFLLQGFDHYVKQELKAKYYVRYADDIVVYGPNKKELHRIQEGMEEYLNGRLRLRMKRNWQVFRTEHEPKGKVRKEGTPGTSQRKKRAVKGRKLDFMGFQMDHKHLTLRKRGMLAATRKARKIWKKKQCGKQITWYDATSMLSHLGKTKNTDTRRMYEERIRPYIDVKLLKKLVSKHSRKENERERLLLERARRLSAGEAA